MHVCMNDVPDVLAIQNGTHLSHHIKYSWYTDFSHDIMGLYSLSERTSYRKISRSVEVARFGFRLFQSLWHLTGTSGAALSRCLSHFRAIRSLTHRILHLRDSTRFGSKTCECLVNRIPGIFMLLLFSSDLISTIIFSTRQCIYC